MTPGPDRCGQSAPGGELCAHAVGHCPLHGIEEPPLTNAVESVFSSAGQPVRFSAATLGRQALRRVIEGQALPAVGLRLVKALESLHRLGPGDDERATGLKEMAIIGGMLNGIPPRSKEDWEIAERLWEPETYELLKMFPQPRFGPDGQYGWVPYDARPVYGAPLSASKAAWGDRAIDYDKYPEPPDHDVPEFHNVHLPSWVQPLSPHSAAMGDED